jgi:hypothetical protein
MKIPLCNFRSVANRVEDLLETKKIGAAYTLAKGAISSAMDVSGAEQAARSLGQRLETSFTRTISDLERQCAQNKPTANKLISRLPSHSGWNRATPKA